MFFGNFLHVTITVGSATLLRDNVIWDIDNVINFNQRFTLFIFKLVKLRLGPSKRKYGEAQRSEITGRFQKKNKIILRFLKLRLLFIILSQVLESNELEKSTIGSNINYNSK